MGLYKWRPLCYTISCSRGISAVGSAQHWQCWGQEFESPMLHHRKPLIYQGFFLVLGRLVPSLVPLLDFRRLSIRRPETARKLYFYVPAIQYWQISCSSWSAACCFMSSLEWPYTSSVKATVACPRASESVLGSTWLCRDRVAKVCPYGIITTNRKSPVYQGFSVIWQGFSSFSKPKNRAAK